MSGYHNPSDKVRLKIKKPIELPLQVIEPLEEDVEFDLEEDFLSRSEEAVYRLEGWLTSAEPTARKCFKPFVNATTNQVNGNVFTDNAGVYDMDDTTNVLLFTSNVCDTPYEVEPQKFYYVPTEKIYIPSGQTYIDRDGTEIQNNGPYPMVLSGSRQLDMGINRRPPVKKGAHPFQIKPPLLSGSCVYNQHLPLAFKSEQEMHDFIFMHTKKEPTQWLSFFLSYETHEGGTLHVLSRVSARTSRWFQIGDLGK